MPFFATLSKAGVWIAAAPYADVWGHDQSSAMANRMLGGWAEALGAMPVSAKKRVVSVQVNTFMKSVIFILAILNEGITI